MIISLLYIILAILSLTFLIFIHELGHYWMARKVGMRVETFSIGFGKPIYQWERDGVKWQIGWILCGGFVKIAGMEGEAGGDPYAIKDGFFGKSPWARIKVLFMGPLVNIVFALIAFTALWGIGGRTKNFAEYTHKIGWVDPKSELYQKGVRPGDEITSYGDHPYQSVGDHLYAPMTGGDQLSVSGYKVDYLTKEKTPFSHSVKPYTHPLAMTKGILTSGIVQPASYIIYDRTKSGQENPIQEGSPLEESGIEYGDQLVWVDGELIFSDKQLHNLINSGKALLTIKRGEESILRRVPRIKVQELKLPPDYKEELVDWQFEAHLNNTNFSTLATLPYVIDDYNVVESRVKFIDPEMKGKVFPDKVGLDLDQPLEPGDLVTAVDGIEVEYPFQVLDLLQTKHLNMIVARNLEGISEISSEEVDQNFDENLSKQDIDVIASTIGTGETVENSGNFYLLKPVVPKKRADFNLPQEAQAQFAAAILEQQKIVDSIDDPERRLRAQKLLEDQENQLLIGLPGIQDRKVNYNPNPFVQFNEVFQQIWRMLGALVTGSLSPKWMSGPVGIVQAVQEQSRTSLKEVLFWLGAISLNLGVLNLIPVPPFDGGGIVIAFSEMISGRRLKAKTMEKLVYPFAIVLIVFFIFITYHDLSRLFGRYFS